MWYRFFVPHFVRVKREIGGENMKQRLQSMMYGLNSKMQHYMVGRYGGDEFGRFISGSVLVFFVVSWITKWDFFRLGAWFLIFYCYFRMF